MYLYIYMQKLGGGWVGVDTNDWCITKLHFLTTYGTAGTTQKLVAQSKHGMLGIKSYQSLLQYATRENGSSGFPTSCDTNKLAWHKSRLEAWNFGYK